MTATPPREGDPALERLVFFSDAVIAIAMTLLALELRVPEGDSDAELWRSFLHLLPGQYLTFAISFVVIAVFWRSHWRFFPHVTRAAPGLVTANILFLFTIVTLPFATKVLGERGDTPFGTAFYALAVASVGLSLLLMLWLVRRDGAIRLEADPEWPARMARAILSTVAAFLASIPIAFSDVSLARYSWLLFPLLFGSAFHWYQRLRTRVTRGAVS